MKYKDCLEGILKIKVYWPNCDLIYDGVDFEGRDAFFLECNIEEAESNFYERISSEQIRQCMRYYEPSENAMKLETESDKIYFLITKDQKKLVPEPWWFPYAGQWNGYSPFRRIKSIEIEELSELINVVIEPISNDDIREGVE